MTPTTDICQDCQGTGSLVYRGHTATPCMTCDGYGFLEA